MIGDSNRFMTPCSSLLDCRFGIGQSIHITHNGMQVQLHTFFTRSCIFTLGHRANHDGIGLQNHFIGEIIHHQASHDPNHTAHFYPIQNRSGLFLFHKTTDANRGCMVGHIKFHNNRIAFGQVLMVNGKHLTFHNDVTHIQINILHGNSIATEGFAKDHIGGNRSHGLIFSGCLSRNRDLADHFAAQALHSIKQSLAFQRMAGLKGDANIAAKAVLQFRADLRGSLFQLLTTIAAKFDQQIMMIPLHCRSSQRSPEHGTFSNKHPLQFLRRNCLQLISRMSQSELHGTEHILLRNATNRI